MNKFLDDLKEYLKTLIYSSEEMIEFGKLIGTYLKMGDCLLLKGSLASGKTTFTKGIGKALDIKEVINSPTFNILKIRFSRH